MASQLQTQNSPDLDTYCKKATTHCMRIACGWRCSFACCWHCSCSFILILRRGACSLACSYYFIQPFPVYC